MKRNIFFSSDWHIGHESVLKYDSRPFTDINHMSRVLINNYNSVVPDDGLCYLLGDMGLCSNDTLKKVISKLNGTKVLILGNHDGGIQAMLNAGFDAVMHSSSIFIANKRVTMTHCPLRGIEREKSDNMAPGENWHGESRHKQYSIEAHDGFHLHGHIHSHPDRKEKSLRVLDRQMDVGVVANKYRPVSISEIESWIALYGR